MAKKDNPYEIAGALPRREAEKYCATAGIEFHPLVCDKVTEAEGGTRCVHSSRDQRTVAEAVYAAEFPPAKEAPAAEVVEKTA